MLEGNNNDGSELGSDEYSIDLETEARFSPWAVISVWETNVLKWWWLFDCTAFLIN